jgi:hypothetical protein
MLKEGGGVHEGKTPIFCEGGNFRTISFRNRFRGLVAAKKISLQKGNGRLAPARVAQAEKPLGSIRRGGLPACLGAHWEGGL